MEESLRLLHPYLPFITEEIYGKLPLDIIIKNRKAVNSNKICTTSEWAGMLIAAPYPVATDARVSEKTTSRFAVLLDLIRSIRALRAECGISPDTKIEIALMITKGSHAEVCHEKTDLIQLLAGVKSIKFVSGKPESAIGAVGEGFEAFILISGGSVDVSQLKARFEKELVKEHDFIAKTTKKLSGKFAENAPVEVVAAEREKKVAAERRAEKLESYLKNL